MNNFTMVIPSYWGRPGPALIDDEKKVFDHPTPLDQQGTLPRLLDSLAIFDDSPCRIVIITVANDPDIAGAVKEHMDSLLAPYRDRYDVANFSLETIGHLRERLSGQAPGDDALALLNLDNYAAVRNMCSLAGVLHDSPATVFIDDDEVFTDKHFFHKIDEHLGASHNGETVRALAGYYLQPDTYRLDVSSVPAWRAEHWNNAQAMNNGFEQVIGRPPRLKPTPFVFGGNMTLTLDALKQVPFDPNITRGEDMDFLINLRIANITFYLDRELSIKHLPPASHRPAWKKVRQDILRFLYQRKKVRDHSEIALDDLRPYPALFLGDDLEERIIKTNQALGQHYLQKNDPDSAGQCDENIHLAQHDPYKDFDTRAWLIQLTQNWQNLTAACHGLGIAT